VGIEEQVTSKRRKKKPLEVEDPDEHNLLKAAPFQRQQPNTQQQQPNTQQQQQQQAGPFHPFQSKQEQRRIRLQQQQLIRPQL